MLDALFDFFNIICHQKPERSFFICGFQFFLCARCTGIYLLLITFLCVNIVYPFKRLFVFLFLALVLNNITAIEIFDKNIIRFFLGSLIGIPAALILKKSFKILISEGENLWFKKRFKLDLHSLLFF